MAYRNSPTLFRTVPSPTPYGRLFPKIGGFATPPKTSIAIISGTGKATNFKFCTHIHRIERNKSPLKNSRSSCGRTQPLSKIFRALIYRAHARSSCLGGHVRCSLYDQLDFLCFLY